MIRRETSIKMVSATELDGQARTWLRFLERETGHPINIARPKVARELGISPGTLRNISENRVKGGIAAWIYERIRHKAVLRMESKINALKTELEIARLATLERNQDTIGTLEHLISKAQETLETLAECKR